jgi:hypothetical protein
MTDGRFRLLLGLLFAVVAAGSFVVVVQLLEDDDGSPGTTTSTTTTFSLTTSTTTGGLETPTFVAIVVSETDEATARAVGDQLTEAGFDNGVLRSDDYTSLEPGFWVTYVGPFDEVEAANDAVADLQAEGWTAAYPRCVGSEEECS